MRRGRRREQPPGRSSTPVRCRMPPPLRRLSSHTREMPSRVVAGRAGASTAGPITACLRAEMSRCEQALATHARRAARSRERWRGDQAQLARFPVALGSSADPSVRRQRRTARALAGGQLAAAGGRAVRAAPPQQPLAAPPYAITTATALRACVRTQRRTRHAQRPRDRRWGLARPPDLTPRAFELAELPFQCGLYRAWRMYVRRWLRRHRGGQRARRHRREPRCGPCPCRWRS